MFASGCALHDGTPFDTEPFGEAGAKFGLIQEPGRARMRIEMSRVERRPTAVRALRRIRDDHMRMELWVAGP